MRGHGSSPATHPIPLSKAVVTNKRASRSRAWLPVFLACLAVVVPTQIRAAPMIIRGDGPPDRPFHLDLTLTAWVDAIGAGLWYAIPVAPHGFIKRLNDSVDIEFGALVVSQDHGHGYGYTTHLLPLGGMRWQFHLTRRWDVFGTAKVGFAWYPHDHDDHLHDHRFEPRAGLSTGAYWHIREDLFLRLEAGYPTGLQVGISFPH